VTGVKSIQRRSPTLVRAVFEAGDAFVRGAMSAAIHLATGFVAVTDDAATTMSALRREHMDGALKAIEIMGDAIADDLDRFVVFVSTALAIVCAGMKGILGIRREFWFQDTRRLFFLVSLDHFSTVA
jgi:hypothetical protein